MKKIVTLTLALLICSFLGYSQEKHVIQVAFDKKTILVDSLGLPQNYTAQGLLRLMPELLERPGATIVTNYDVKVDGMSLGDAADAALSQLKIADIERVDISESPISSYQNRGQGGSINLVLRKKSKTEKEFWGTASVNRLYDTDLTPQFLVSAKKEKLFVRALLLSQLYDIDPRNFWDEMERVYINYRPTQQDELNLNVSNSTSRDVTSAMSAYIRDKESDFRSFLSYRHAFNNRSEFYAEAQYVYQPTNYINNNDAYMQKNNFYTNTLGGQVNCKYWITEPDARNRLNVNGGVNINYQDMNNRHTLYRKPLGNKDEIHSNDYLFFLMPYISFESAFGAFRFKAVGEWQNVNYDINIEDKEHTVTNRKHFTGKIMAGWQLEKNKFLRLVFDRKLLRPTFEQIYPSMVFSPDRLMYVKGNEELTPTLSHEVSLDYIFDKRWDEHYTTFNAGISYNHVSNIIESKIIGGEEDINTSPLGLTQKYITFVNNGTNNIFNVNMMFLYRYKIFSLSLTGNLYNNKINDDGKDPHFNYYSISALPTLNFTNGWNISSNVVYHSKVSSSEANLNDISYFSLGVGKEFGRFYANVSAKCFLVGKQNNKNNVGFGIMYHL